MFIYSLDALWILYPCKTSWCCLVFDSSLNTGQVYTIEWQVHLMSYEHSNTNVIHQEMNTRPLDTKNNALPIAPLPHITLHHITHYVRQTALPVSKPSGQASISSLHCWSREPMTLTLRDSNPTSALISSV